MNNHQPAAREPFRVIKGLLLGYLGIGIAALVTVILLRNHRPRSTGRSGSGRSSSWRRRSSCCRRRPWATALGETLGRRYEVYRAHTKRLVPGRW